MFDNRDMTPVYFTATQAAQKNSKQFQTFCSYFTATQAAQKMLNYPDPFIHPFTATQAAQKYVP